MGKALGIDYGAKRTGLAITDDLQIIASPLEAVDTKAVFQRIEALVASENISDIVVGDPDVFGGTSDSSASIHKFCAELKKRYPAQRHHRVDESFSSREAMSAMVAGGMKKSQRREKKNLDKVSAAVILQRWLAQNH
jgi:putative Holliday junction resolvase